MSVGMLQVIKVILTGIKNLNTEGQDISVINVNTLPSPYMVCHSIKKPSMKELYMNVMNVN